MAHDAVEHCYSHYCFFITYIYIYILKRHNSACYVKSSSEPALKKCIITYTVRNKISQLLAESIASMCAD